MEVFWTGLDTPINLLFTKGGDVLVADAGVLTGSGKVGVLTSSGYKVIADGFKPPLTGINEFDGNIFMSPTAVRLQ
jgi:hypothetical protein